MGIYYAQMDKDGRIKAVSELAGEVKADDMIPIDSYDVSLLGKIYNAETKTFADDPTPKPAAVKTGTQQILEKLTAMEGKIDTISLSKATA